MRVVSFLLLKKEYMFLKTLGRYDRIKTNIHSALRGAELNTVNYSEFFIISSKEKLELKRTYIPNKG